MSRLTERRKKGVYERYWKRPQDFVCAAVALVLLSPMLLLTACLVRIFLGRPVLFRQERPGYGEKIFLLYKFRTMTDKRAEDGSLLPDEKRLTAFGSFLRSASLDELPELFNILKGDMSFVGPRPLLIKYLPLYNDEQRKRHDVRPGLTGLAQVNGRNTLNWEQKFDLDLKYAGNITFREDWKIILRTAGKVFEREGIHSTTSGTMEEFKGSRRGG